MLIPKKLAYFLRKLYISRAHIAKSKRCLNTKSLRHFFYLKTKILADFQICISVPLRIQVSILNFKWHFLHQLFKLYSEKHERFVSDGSHKPFHKPNSDINYIHRESNHHTSIIKQLPLSVESRLSKLSSDENVFIQAASVYQEALKRAGYNYKPNCNNSDKYNSNNKNNNNNNCNNNATKNDNN